MANWWIADTQRERLDDLLTAIDSSSIPPGDERDLLDSLHNYLAAAGVTVPQRMRELRQNVERELNNKGDRA